SGSSSVIQSAEGAKNLDAGGVEASSDVQQRDSYVSARNDNGVNPASVDGADVSGEPDMSSYISEAVYDDGPTTIDAPVVDTPVEGDNLPMASVPDVDAGLLGSSVAATINDVVAKSGIARTYLLSRAQERANENNVHMKIDVLPEHGTLYVYLSDNNYSPIALNTNYTTSTSATGVSFKAIPTDAGYMPGAIKLTYPDGQVEYSYCNPINGEFLVKPDAYVPPSGQISNVKIEFVFDRMSEQGIEVGEHGGAHRDSTDGATLMAGQSTVTVTIDGVNEGYQPIVSFVCNEGTDRESTHRATKINDTTWTYTQPYSNAKALVKFGRMLGYTSLNANVDSPSPVEIRLSDDVSDDNEIYALMADKSYERMQKGVTYVGTTEYIACFKFIPPRGYMTDKLHATFLNGSATQEATFERNGWYGEYYFNLNRVYFVDPTLTNEWVISSTNKPIELTYKDSEHGSFTYVYTDAEGNEFDTPRCDDTVTIRPVADKGYECSSVNVNSQITLGGMSGITLIGNATKQDDGTYIFNVPNTPTDVSVNFSLVNYSLDMNVTSEDGQDHGSITTDKTTYNYGNTVTLTPDLDYGYYVKTLKVTSTSKPAPAPGPDSPEAFSMRGSTMTDSEVEANWNKPDTNTSASEVNITAEKDGTYTFLMPDSDVSVEAVIAWDEDTPYHVTTVIENEKIPSLAEGPEPSNDIEVSPEATNAGDTVTITPVPENYYVCESVTLDGVELTAQDDGTYTFSMPDHHVVVKAKFIPCRYEITLGENVNKNGKLSVSVMQNLAYGDSVAITASPNDDYYLKTLTVKTDGVAPAYVDPDTTTQMPGNVEVTKVSEGYFTFNMPGSNVLVDAEFEKIPARQYEISVISPDITKGAVSIEPELAAAGTTVTVTVDPIDHYEVAQILLNGATLAPDAGSGTRDEASTYTFEMPSRDCELYVAFTPIEYLVDIPSVTGGTVTSNPTQALPGARVALDVAPSAGYKLDTLTVTDANGAELELYD
ncbi:hypothetical protein, partial [uncultured Duncaniella sp.]|uniref:InlB B-repeat-containing protein n=1 Tax=uncultured Duncaniella sp. TaxID=2768039 RepID=UPI0025AA0F10